MTRIDKIHKLLEVTGNSFSDEDMMYVLSRLEQAEALLKQVNAVISRDDSYLDVGADIDDYFSARAGEGAK